jgi:hypothetical protein
MAECLKDLLVERGGEAFATGVRARRVALGLNAGVAQLAHVPVLAVGDIPELDPSSGLNAGLVSVSGWKSHSHVTSVAAGDCGHSV